MAASLRHSAVGFVLTKSCLGKSNLCFISRSVSRHLLIQGQRPSTTIRHFTSSHPKYDLMEFFDDSKMWGEETVKVGRAWRKEELRIKSNVDLHKLWYVLLKEKNMLLTMEAAHNREYALMPNPERLDKVEESMENLEDIVRERNKAYYELETMESGEAPTVDTVTPMGKMKNREIKEYPIPKHMNEKWKEEQIEIDPKELVLFNKRLRERDNIWSRRAQNRNKRHVLHLFKRFPNLDEEAIRDQYPDVDIDMCKKELEGRIWQ